jgi:hypothetical protein
MLPLPQRLAHSFGIVGHVAPSTQKSLFVMAAVKFVQRCVTGYAFTAISNSSQHRRSLYLNVSHPI